jgi:ssRNA-specific RNase YbeY (16S rRNA maturation enzyme)
MSNYAKIENNIVVNVIVCDDSNISSLNGDYVKITESTNDATFGAQYNTEHNKFADIKIYESWVLNPITFIHEAPIAKPATGSHAWNEENQEWVELVPGTLE